MARGRSGPPVSGAPPLCHAFLECCLLPEVQRIVLLDAPTAMSWEQWREVDARYGLGSLKAGLEDAHRQGVIPVESEEAAAHLLLTQ